MESFKRPSNLNYNIVDVDVNNSGQHNQGQGNKYQHYVVMGDDFNQEVAYNIYWVFSNNQYFSFVPFKGKKSYIDANLHFRSENPPT